MNKRQRKKRSRIKLADFLGDGTCRYRFANKQNSTLFAGQKFTIAETFAINPVTVKL